MRYVFGDYTLDAERYELRQAGRLVPLEPRVFDLLAYLVQHPGRTVLTEELLTQLYPNEFAPVERLTNAVAQARRVLHDTAQTQRYIQTVRRRGYSLCVPVTLEPGAADVSAPPTPDTLEAGVGQATVQANARASPPPLPLDLPPAPPPAAPMAGMLSPLGPGMPQAERRQLTVLVCRLVRVAARAAPLDPEEQHEVAEDYAQMGAEVVHRFDGYLVPQDQGDRLVVYFGYPRAHEDDARRAVYTGLGIVEAMAQLNRGWTRDQGVQLGVRIGIHTGGVVVGARGQDGREAFTRGNTATLADQVQGLASPDTVVISATTLRLVERYVDAQALGTYILEDLAEPLAVYQILQAWATQTQFGTAGITRLTALVGREQEMALLRARWAQVHNGWGQVVLLSGEPGIGKSRLVQEFKNHLVGEAYTLIECHASSYHQQSAFYPVIGHIQRRLQWRKDATPEEKLCTLEAVLGAYDFALEEVVPLFAGLLSLPLADRYTPLTLTPERQKQKTLEALLIWLLRETERQPVCLLLEDLHWVDPSTLEWLSLLIDQIPTTRVLLLLTFRPEFQPPWAVRSHLTYVTLGRLSPRQTEGMIGQVVGDKPLPAEVLHQVVATTDGVPLFVEELTKMVIELGLVKEREGRYELTGPLPALAIPATLHDSLMARLDRLGAAKQIAQLGAVVGRGFAYEVLRAVSPVEEPALQHALARLVEAELLYQRGLPPQATYVFKHALIQEAAYQSLLRHTRQQSHQQIARVLEADFPTIPETQPELLAYHYMEAGLKQEAIVYWHRAGQRAIKRSAHVEAIGHVTKGLEVLKTLPDTPERTQQELLLHMTLGSPLIATKGYAAQEVEHVYTRARALCQQVGDTQQLFSVLWGLRRFYNLRGELQTARDLGEQLLSLAQSIQDVSLRGMAHYGMGATLCLLGEFAPARAHLEQGLALYAPRQHHSTISLYASDLEVQCLCYYAWVLWSLGYPDQALKRIHEALTLARQFAHSLPLAHALGMAAKLHHLRRERQTAQKLAEAVIALSAEQGFPYWVAHGTITRGWALAEQGQGEEGIEQIRQGMAALRATGARENQAYVPALLAEAYAKGGQIEEGFTVLAEALAVVTQDVSPRYYTAELYRLTGEFLLALSPENQAEAEAHFRHALSTACRQRAKSLELRAVMSLSRLWQQQDKHAEAHEMLAEIYSWFTEGFDTPDLQEAKALLEELA
jgi:class 3 adenylate cyclase/DNA-binding winged helix-turn-helix (wHTH) protein/predicted ATPase